SAGSTPTAGAAAAPRGRGRRSEPSSSAGLPLPLRRCRLVGLSGRQPERGKDAFDLRMITGEAAALEEDRAPAGRQHQGPSLLEGVALGRALDEAPCGGLGPAEHRRRAEGEAEAAAKAEQPVGLLARVDQRAQGAAVSFLEVARL